MSSSIQYIVEVQRDIGSNQYTFESFVFQCEDDFKKYLFHNINNFKTKKKNGNLYKYQMEPNPTLIEMVRTFRQKSHWKLKYFSIQKINHEVLILSLIHI